MVQACGHKFGNQTQLDMTPASPKERNILLGCGWSPEAPDVRGGQKGTAVGKVPVRSAEPFWAVSFGTQHCQSIVILKMMKRLRYRQQMAPPSHGMWGVGVTVSVRSLKHTHPKSWCLPGPG